MRLGSTPTSLFGFGFAALAVVAVPFGVAAASGPAGRPAAPRASVGAVREISGACHGQNAEVEQAVDRSGRDVYELWMGCGGIGFARSTDAGRRFLPGRLLPGSAGGTWDPAIAVGPDGTVYASFMATRHGATSPVVDASFDRGRTFAQVVRVTPPFRQNWGDRDFIAVGPAGTVYLTWDYGPSNAAVTDICPPGGSCAFATGDLNVVVQRSTDRGRTWSQITPVSPGFPASGGDSAPLVVQPNGRVDAEYQGYDITSVVRYTMRPAHSYFTSSADGGRTWSAPVRLGPGTGTMSLAEWWIDGDIAADAAGDLYATWDTQSGGADIGWLTYSTDGGRSWSSPLRVTPDADRATHIVEVAGGRPGTAYVGWLTDSPAGGYAEFLRPFAVGRGWLSAPVRVSRRFGVRSVWPGDTFGITAVPAGRAERVLLSWGSALPGPAKPRSEIFAAAVTFAARG